MNIDDLSTALIVIIGVPLATALWVIVVEWVLSRLMGERRRRRWRPWLWLLPAFGFLGLYLIYPMIQTLIYSFQDRDALAFVGFDNYSNLFTDDTFWRSVINNLLWIVFFSGVVLVLAVLLAVMADRVRYEVAVKVLIFIPLALSFVAAGVIWNFMYDFDERIGTFNAFWTIFADEPVAWLTESWPRNTFMLILVGIWMWTGFAMVILSAGVKGIPDELLEAARIDGANELQVFFRVILPLLMPTVAVVGTTLVITALKTFDIVYVMTGGRFRTDVLANRFYSERFIERDVGASAAVAVILLLAIIPVMVINVRRFRAQEAIR